MHQNNKLHFIKGKFLDTFFFLKNNLQFVYRKEEPFLFRALKVNIFRALEVNMTILYIYPLWVAAVHSSPKGEPGSPPSLKSDPERLFSSSEKYLQLV